MSWQVIYSLIHYILEMHYNKQEVNSKLKVIICNQRLPKVTFNFYMPDKLSLIGPNKGALIKYSELSSSHLIRLDGISIRAFAWIITGRLCVQ